MPPYADNPFAVLTAVVAPAVLTNACSVLCLGTGNRIARVVDRSRIVAKELAGLEAGSAERKHWDTQLALLQQRAKRLFWALRLLYGALGAFATAALIAIVGAATASFEQGRLLQIVAAAGFTAGCLGVTGLVCGCALMVSEVRLAIQHIAEEAAEWERQGSHEPKSVIDSGEQPF